MQRQYPYNASELFSNPSVNLGNILIAGTYVLALFGFHSIAPIISVIANERESTISIGLRALILGGAFMLLFFAKAPKNIGSAYYLAPLVLMLLAFAARAYQNIYIENIQIYIPSGILYSFLFGAGLIPALMVARLSARIQDRHFLYAMVICSLLFLIGLSFNIEALTLSNEARARLSISRVNAIAMTSMAFNFCLFYFLFFGHSKSIKYLAVIVVPVCLLIAAYSKSRGPIVAVIFTVIVYFFMTRAKHRKHILQAGLALLFVTIILNYSLGINLFSTLLERFFQSVETNNYLSVTIRQAQWSAAWQGFLEDPLFGRYVFEQTYYFYPHNVFLECLMALGFCGGLLYLSHMFFSFRACFLILKSDLANKAALFSVLLFLKSFAESMFSGNIWGSSTLWICSAFIISYAHFLKNSERLQSRNIYSRNVPIRRQQIARDFT